MCVYSSSITRIIYDFFCAITLSVSNLCLMVCFKYTAHAKYKIECEVNQGGTLFEGALKLCQCAPKMILI